MYVIEENCIIFDVIASGFADNGRTCRKVAVSLPMTLLGREKERRGASFAAQ